MRVLGNRCLIKSAIAISDHHHKWVPGLLLAFAAPVAVGLFYSAPFFSFRWLVSARFFWDHPQSVRALVRAVFLLPGAVAALVALLPPAEQPFCVLFRVSGQASVAPLFHPVSELAFDRVMWPREHSPAPSFALLRVELWA